MREYIVTCDRCRDVIEYDESNDKLIGGATFMIPIVLASGNIATNTKQIDLCKRCIWDLKKFIDYLR